MPEYLFPFEKLDVWQLAVNLAEYVLDLIDRRIPKNKQVRLVGQMEAAVTSPAHNISFTLLKDPCMKWLLSTKFFEEEIFFRKKKHAKSEEGVNKLIGN